MPELPEVETTRRGIAPHLINQRIIRIIVREKRLRWPVPALNKYLAGHHILDIGRRAKYLILYCDSGGLIIHLGMSGSLRIVDAQCAAHKHDHVDIILESGKILRYRDPRKFGCILWFNDNPNTHKLLAQLGIEPFDEQFNGDYLFQRSRNRKLSVKQFIMNAQIVVGVGNIYASEALFNASIRPSTVSRRVSRIRYQRLSESIKEVLTHALNSGGTTLKDFVHSDGQPGYFQQKLHVYGRAGEPCHQCGTAIRKIVQGQRSSYYCHRCQS